MPNDSRARELVAYSFMVVFANDGTIDENELAMLEKLALKDGQVDEEERQVLRNIFSRVGEGDVTEAVWQEIGHFRNKYAI